MSITYCLDCEREIKIDAQATLGQRIACRHCGVTLEIINVDPPELDWVYDGPIAGSKLFDEWWLMHVNGIELN